MDLFARVREIERELPGDTSDGSLSWFQMNHEEAVLLAADGSIVHRVGAGNEVDVVRYPKGPFDIARRGGLIMHSHPVWCGASFSLSDVWACFSNPHEAGMVMVVCTSNSIGGRLERVRYIMDSRSADGPFPKDVLARLSSIWDREEREVFDTLSQMGDWATDEELLGIHQHSVVERVCRLYGVEYRREIA
jgi:hypothetical protein